MTLKNKVSVLTSYHFGYGLITECTSQGIHSQIYPLELTKLTAVQLSF